MTDKSIVFIATPCFGGQVYQGYMESIVKLIYHSIAQDFFVMPTLNGNDSLITRSRNRLVSIFLDVPSATHLMFIDADISFEPEAVSRMMKFDQDVVAGAYPAKAIDWTGVKSAAALNMDERRVAEAGLRYVGQPCNGAEREERDGFVTGVYAGTGFMLIKRAVLERMITAYPETKFSDVHVVPRSLFRSENQFALFDCFIDPKTKAYLSEDFAFCQRWRALGGKIWLDMKTELTHTGTYKYKGLPNL